MAYVSVNTSEWSRSNRGRQPKGRGYWMFKFTFYDGSAEWYDVSGTYADARKAAVTEAQKRGAYGVTVGP